jgi:hypothetical protein
MSKPKKVLVQTMADLEKAYRELLERRVGKWVDLEKLKHYDTKFCKTLGIQWP